MKSIIETTIDILKEKQEPIGIQDLIKEINPGHFTTDDINMNMSIVYSELISDGRFILVSGMWDLKDNYTLAEIAKHKSLEFSLEDELDELMALADEDEDEITRKIILSDEEDLFEADAIDLDEIDEEDDIIEDEDDDFIDPLDIEDDLDEDLDEIFEGTLEDTDEEL
ncbi:MAG: DNA-directed RNA polymerase subunit delta [Mycoplasmatales bacterium]